MADNENIKDSGAPSEKPDISFGAPTGNGMEKGFITGAKDTNDTPVPVPAPASAPPEIKREPPQPSPALKKQPVPAEIPPGRAKTAQGNTKKAPKDAEASAPKGKKRPANKAPDSAKPKNVKPKKVSSKGKPTKHVKPVKAQRPAPKPADNSANGQPQKPKVKFTKKQAMQVTGLIIVLFLIFGLAVFLIFNHYFNLLGGEAEEVTNSSPKLYSDVDYSKPDTFEKSVEDEKLKELTNKAEKITSSDVMNILLVGEDLRDTAEKDAGNTDVMMLISINTKDDTITLTSIMRDCYVNFGNDDIGWYSDRINAAYWYGGMRLTKSTIEDYLNVKIDRYVLVNFKVFIDIVDSLGGIDMHVTDLEANGDPNEDPDGDNTRGMQNPLDEQNKYLGNKKKTDYIKKGGDLHLNGNQALAYARLRHVGNADYERTERQRRVIKEMIKESRHMSLVEMDKLANKVFPQVKTDITKGELAGLLLEMLNYRNYKVQEFRVPSDETFSNEFIDGKDVLLVDFAWNQELFRELAYGTADIKEPSKSKME